jgi:two-component system nitrogen regulation response regulator GlnG
VLRAGGERPDVVFLDVRLPGTSGIETLTELRQSQSSLPVVVMTAFGDLKTAVDAIQGKSFDYLTKPFALDVALSAARRAIRGRIESGPSTRTPAEELPVGDGFLGMSPRMQEVYKQIAIAANGDWPVLIVGEQGVGKGSVCRLIHGFSRRSPGPLLTFYPNPKDPLDCLCELFGLQTDRIPESLPTRWLANRAGLLQLGADGTVVVDEVLLSPLHLQIRLLEAIEAKRWLPLGGSVAQNLTARLLFTSTTPLSGEMDDGEIYPQLRSQLQLNVIPLPTLAERSEDIPQLIDALLRQIAPQGELKISEEAVTELQGRDWPGNLRQLNQTIQAAAQRCSGGTIRVDDLGLRPTSTHHSRSPRNSIDEMDRAVRQWVADSCQALGDSKATPAPESFLYEECLQVVERALFEAVLQATGGNRAKSADILGIHRTTLRQKSKRYGVE